MPQFLPCAVAWTVVHALSRDHWAGRRMLREVISSGMDTREMPKRQQINGSKTLKRILGQSYAEVRWPFQVWWDESA